MLTLRYAAGLDAAAVQEPLAISQSTYYRAHQRGLAVVIALLREQWHLAEDDHDDTPTVRAQAERQERASETPVPHNLPAQLTSFVGRERELAELQQKLGATRLLTLTGVGGCDKTRLAIQVAMMARDTYSGGVWFVDLAPVADPTLVLQTVAGALGVREHPGTSLLDALVDSLSECRALLLTIDGVWLATHGYADGVCKDGFPPLREVLGSFVANGGQIWACGTCTKPRGITATDLVEGARIVTAANVVEYVAGGVATLSF